MSSQVPSIKFDYLSREFSLIFSRNVSLHFYLIILEKECLFYAGVPLT